MSFRDPWVMGQMGHGSIVNGSRGSWVKLSDPSSTLVRVVVRVWVRVSVCPSFGPWLCASDKFPDANSVPTPDCPSDRPRDGPTDGPTWSPTFSRRGYVKINTSYALVIICITY